MDEVLKRLVKHHIDYIETYLNGVYVGKQSNAQVRKTCLDMIRVFKDDIGKWEDGTS